MVIYFNNNELSTTPIFSTTLKDWGDIMRICEIGLGGYVYLKVYKLFVKGLWLSFKMMKVLFYYMFVFCSNIVFIYNKRLDVVCCRNAIPYIGGMHGPWGGVCVYIYVHKLKYWDKD